MSASSSRCNSAAHTAPVTPSLSPQLHSSDWRHTTGRSNMSSSTYDSASDKQPSQEWWEHVLPPGQLAERLRKAQRSSSASRRRNNPALANATPSERSAWKRLSGLPVDKTNTSASSSKRSSFEEQSSGHLRASIDDMSDESISPSGRRSPARHACPTSGVTPSSSGAHSPEQPMLPWPVASASFHSPPMSRSTSGRRCRISSEDGNISSTRTISTPQSVLPRSYSAVNIKRTPPIETHSLPDTPEFSSDDNVDSRSSLPIPAQAKPALSRRRAPPTILRSSFEHPDQITTISSDKYASSEHSHAEKHVSFDEPGNVFAERRFSSSDTFNFPTFASHINVDASTTLPRANSTRRARQGVRINGRKTTSFSLPSSRRSSLHDDLRFPENLSDSFTPSETRFSHGRSASLSDAALLDSLNAAHKQLASAKNIAVTVTRQLSAPLRPVFHLTLFFSISSITVASLACFLLFSYMLTAWDDMSQRSQQVSRVAVQTKTKVESGLEWGIKILGSAEADTVPSESKTDPRAGDDAKGSSRSKRVSPPTASGVVFWPMRIALHGAGSIASRVTPAPIADMFVSKENVSPQPPYPATSSRPTQRQTGSTLPPRPPLSLLLPSIMFTLVIAIGAGLTSFFASRRAAAEGIRRPPTQSRTSSPGAYAYGKSSPSFVHIPASFSTTPTSPPIIDASYFPRPAAARDRFLRPQAAF